MHENVIWAAISIYQVMTEFRVFNQVCSISYSVTDISFWRSDNSIGHIDKRKLHLARFVLRVVG